MSEIDQKIFNIAKSIANQELTRKFLAVNYELNQLEKKLNQASSSIEAKVLLKMLKSEIDNNNTRIRQQSTKLEKLKYKGVSSYKSKLFKDNLKVSITKIQKAVLDNPGLDYYDVFITCFRDVPL